MRNHSTECLLTKCHLPRHPGSSVCSEHLEAAHRDLNRKVARGDAPRGCLKCGEDIPKRRYQQESAYCSDDCYFGYIQTRLRERESTTSAAHKTRFSQCVSCGTNFERAGGFRNNFCSVSCYTRYDGHIEKIVPKNSVFAASENVIIEKGFAMTIQTYDKQTLIEYTEKKIEECREVIEDFANAEVNVLRQFLADIDDGKVDKDHLGSELHRRQTAAFEDLFKKHDADSGGAKSRLDGYEKLLRRLEAISGDTMQLNDEELRSMKII